MKETWQFNSHQEMIQMDKMKFKILGIFKVGDVLDRTEKFKKYVETSFQDR